MPTTNQSSQTDLGAFGSQEEERQVFSKAHQEHGQSALAGCNSSYLNISRASEPESFMKNCVQSSGCSTSCQWVVQRQGREGLIKLVHGSPKDFKHCLINSTAFHYYKVTKLPLTLPYSCTSWKECELWTLPRVCISDFRFSKSPTRGIWQY